MSEPWNVDWKAYKKETEIELGEVDALQVERVKDMYTRFYGIEKFKVFPGLNGKENKRFLKAVVETCDELKEKLEANGWQLEEHNGRRDGTYSHAAIRKYTPGSTFIIENKDPKSDEKILFKKTILPMIELLGLDAILTTFPDEVKKLPKYKIAVFGRYWKQTEKPQEKQEYTEQPEETEEQPHAGFAGQPDILDTTRDLKEKAEKLKKIYEQNVVDPNEIARQMQEIDKEVDKLEQKLDEIETKEDSSETGNLMHKKIMRDFTGKWPGMRRKKEEPDKKEQTIQLGITRWDSARYLEKLYKKHYGINKFEYKKLDGDLLIMYAIAETYDPLVESLEEQGWKLEQRMEMPDPQMEKQIKEKYEQMKKERKIASYDLLTITTPTIDEEMLLGDDIMSVDSIIKKSARGKEIGKRAKMHSAVFVRQIKRKR